MSVGLWNLFLESMIAPAAEALFFHPHFVKGKKNVSIFAVILVWLWCWKEKLSLLTSFNNQMSSDPLNFSKCNYNWNVLKSFRQGRRLAWLIWDLLLELRCKKKVSLWPLEVRFGDVEGL